MMMSVDDLTAFLAKEYPQLAESGDFVVDEVAPMSAKLRMRYDRRHLRPGGTISGPSMFTLADVGLYCAILGELGPVAMAVTTNLNINFLRMPGQRDLVAVCRLHKLGKRLAVGEASLVQAGPDGRETLVAHATATYSIPPRSSSGDAVI
ncbi:MAG: PaaI family thioesterase [Beijerinckiaceae bacterium]|nr:PaaI family thioesterase [Beijerinckiaceae bacterium]